MRVALLDARQGDRDPANSSTVAYRNMLVLANELGADLYVSARQLARAPSDYEAIICGFGSTSCERDESVKFLDRNRDARLYWLVGEYEQSTFAPLFYAKRPYHVLKNYEHEMRNKQAIAQTFVNLNALLAGQPPGKKAVPKYGAIYYGRWREDRATYFSRYLVGNVFLSTSPKNMKIFSAHGCKPRYARAMSWDSGRETLRLFAASLYIEDKFTHSHYNCPANRYYEALRCGTPILTQPEAQATWDKYGLDMPPWRVVHTASDLDRVARDLQNDDAMMQQATLEQSAWAFRAMADRADALDVIRKAIAS